MSTAPVCAEHFLVDVSCYNHHSRCRHRSSRRVLPSHGRRHREPRASLVVAPTVDLLSNYKTTRGGVSIPHCTAAVLAGRVHCR